MRHLLDHWLPCGADLAGQHQLGPQVDEQGAVDVAQEIVGHSLTQHDLVAASTLATIISCSVAERLRRGRPPVRRDRLGSGPLAGSNSASMGSGSSWTGRFVIDHHPHGVRMPVPREHHRRAPGFFSTGNEPREGGKERLLVWMDGDLGPSGD